MNHLGTGIKFMWHVVLRNEIMGYQKSFCVEALNYLHAVSRAGDELRGKGYKTDDFVAIEVVRKSFA